MLDFLAEQRIVEAVSRGELDNLPGAGKPLVLEDDPLVPEELRLAYRILKNAGFVPREVEDAERARALKKLSLMKPRLDERYYDKAIAKLCR
ncbi:MAG: DUF1992 domain-containing protein [Betaproteobacteria bacterium]|nr:MAG: DUF1992 domain-containing protein [Betaproteobacteria bacterium]